jgi:hypothetical protein
VGELNGELVSDHYALKFDVPVGPRERLGFQKCEVSKMIDVKRACSYAKKAFASRTAVRIQAALRSWDATESTPDTLDARMQHIAQMLWEEAIRCLPVRKTGRAIRRVTKEAARLRKVARYLRALVSRVDALVCGRITRKDGALLSAVRNVSRIGLPVPDVVRLTAGQWQDWGGSILGVLQSVTTRLARVNACDPERTTRLSSRLWRRGRGNRDFFRRLLRGQSASKLDSAYDPETGCRTWDSSVYRPLVAEKVGRIFSTRVDTPGESAQRHSYCVGACGASESKGRAAACKDVRCMEGLPDWWWDYYGHDKVSTVGTEVFRDIMRPATLETILSTLKGVPDGKAPGRDGVSVVLLKVLCDPEFIGCPAVESPIVEVLGRLTNDSLALGYVPRHAKDGVISMIPKGGAAGVRSTLPVTTQNASRFGRRSHAP